MFGEHYRLNGHEVKQTLGDIRGHRSLHLQSMGLQRLGHDLVTEECVFTKEDRWISNKHLKDIQHYYTFKYIY